MLSQFHRDAIDYAVNDMLELFFELPPENAIAALATLTTVPMMGEAEREYPALPELFHDPVYEKVQTQLKLLCEIMYNRQPQDKVKYTDDQADDTNHGKFGLRTVGKETVTAQAVHQYMRYKFALTAGTVATFESTINSISNKNREPFHKFLYYKYLTQWVRQSSGEPIPNDMKTIIRNAAIKMAEAALADKSFAPFQPFMQMKGLSTKNEETLMSINSEEIINSLYSMSPNLYEPVMAPCIEKLFYNKLDKLKDDSYPAVQKKLQDQLNNAGGKFLNLENVCLDFMAVAKANEALLSYKEIIRSHDEMLIDNVSALCRKYVKHLQNNDAEKQLPLEDVDADAVKQFLVQADEFANEKKLNDWISNFFAAYFASKWEDRESLETKIFNLVLNQDKLFIVNDQWLGKIIQENFNIEDNEVAITLTPYHVNRILLHALTTPVEKWSHAYHDIFAEILNLLNDANNSLYTTQALKRDSYPQKLLGQLNWLNHVYEVQINNNGETEEQPLSAFPMLYYTEQASDFGQLLNHFSPEQINIVCNILKEKLPQIVKSSKDFNHLLYFLPTAKRSAIYEIFKEKLPSMIYTVDDFRYVITYLTPDEITTFCNIFKDKLPGIIQNMGDFIRLPNHLTAEQITALCNSFKLTGIINNIKDLKNLFRIHSLPVGKKNAIYASFNNKLPDIISSVLMKLSAKEITIFYNKHWFKLSGIIKDTVSLRELLSRLSAQQITAFCSDFTDKLPGIIKNIDDLNKVLVYLSTHQGTALYEIFKDKLPDIIKNPRDIVNALYYLSPEQIIAVCNIKDGRDLGKILSYLSPEQIIPFSNSCKNKLPDILKNINDFNIVFVSLSTEQITAFCNSSFKDKLSGLINNINDLDTVFTQNFLSIRQRKAVYESFRNELPSIFGRVLMHLFPWEIASAYISFKYKLPGFIRNINDFNMMLKPLSTNQTNTVYKCFKIEIPDMINNAKDFSDACKYLSPSRIVDLCSSFKKKLSGIIENPHDLMKVLEHLSPEQITAFCSSFSDILPGIIKSGYNLNALLENLFSGQVISLCNSLKDALPDILNSINELKISVISILDNEFLKNLLVSTNSSIATFNEFILNSLDEKRRENFINLLDNEFIKILVKNTFDHGFTTLKSMLQPLPIKLLKNFVGSFSLFVGKHYGTNIQKNILQGLKECLALNESPEIRKNILFCILNVYKVELNSREDEFNPTMFGFSLPGNPEWGISKTNKLKAVNALFKVLSNTLSPEDAFNAHKEALGQGTLNDFFSALKTVKEREFKSTYQISSPKK